MAGEPVFTKLYYATFRGILSLIEKDVVPDFLVRSGIRYLLGQRYKDLTVPGEVAQARLMAFVDELKQLPVAVQTAAANEQHYEVPTEYFLLVLGKHLKYSSCLYKHRGDTLGEAEEAMLDLTCRRAELEAGQSILELGCGWGSLSLFMAARFPTSTITAVSNSRTQKEFIDSQAAARGLTNLQVVTADMVVFDTDKTFHRVVSVEMFEHMKNYQVLLRRIAGWLLPGGKCFVHMFVNQRLPYHFEDKGDDDWMTRYFFSGGTMASRDLLLYFQDDVSIERQWYVNGQHYSRTLEAWLERQDAQRPAIMQLFKRTYGEDAALRWWVYWRLFYMACSELFKYKDGEEWGIGHYLFVRK